MAKLSSTQFKAVDDQASLMPGVDVHHSNLQPYRLSFGTGGLHVNEAVELASIYRRCEDWAEATKRALGEEVFSSRRESSGKRLLRETAHKLRELNTQELEVFIEGDAEERTCVIWIGTCRAYRLIEEFAIEVLGKHYSSYIPNVTYDDFDAFIERKAEWAPELERLELTTRQKLRAVLFRLMREAGLIDQDNRILAIVLPPRVQHLWEDGDGGEFECFPLARRA
ncbi:MAG: DUF1819 family protein [Aquidulcibacter sp.]|jgi:hypothetical protein|uniref:DUF1819 family protein n=1 Tax=Aquidulcibacter sp. TaxID=2052990 RepID=UPI0022C46D29|nr:DUF1819 family protein [Aquidulcibacter sp.]MCE2892636.1 DUF1819 family protein [Hyphomonadaceae bacterium]MCZ8207525.1 DUF1819 family protein [Aquidulcibacter sp.]